jgi:predicted transcriptional regulator
MNLDEAKPNGHAEPVTRAWDARLARIERRLADIAETGKQQIVILRDAIADFTAAELAKRDDEIRILKEYIADLERGSRPASSRDRHAPRGEGRTAR